MLREQLMERKVPLITAENEREWETARREYRETLLREEYGRPLPPPEAVSFEVQPIKSADRRFAAGLATCYTVVARVTLFGKEFSFPFQALIPNREGKYPFVIHNDFAAGVPTKGAPAEEILQRGFALFHLFYQDVTADNGDFTSGLAGLIYDRPEGSCRGPEEPGKLAMWAWANMRVMDYAMTLDCLDHAAGAVIGHSRLGKTALLTGLLDERFRFIIANNSGCSGDALSRGNKGEQISDITSPTRFHYWFCENYRKYAERGYGDFDQHQLLACLAPRTVLIGAAQEDGWADPVSQYLSCVAASPAWRAMGAHGLIAPDRLPEAGENFADGGICYHLRSGTHYLSRDDWNLYLDAIQSKR